VSRSSAAYECVSSGSDGNLERFRSSAIVYGTAFGYRHDGGDTLLLTNDRVAEWHQRAVDLAAKLASHADGNALTLGQLWRGETFTVAR
jgi:hypothetical protein